MLAERSVLADFIAYLLQERRDLDRLVPRRDIPGCRNRWWGQQITKLDSAAECLEFVAQQRKIFAEMLGQLGEACLVLGMRQFVELGELFFLFAMLALRLLIGALLFT
jgi:hypothetical protein